ncbi:FG-GAP-like repeat-containing protein [Aliiglaciecola sp. M165]|uniref:FG-GAP-like repeat-containing protein n=1 Tax=Aliiglaciecola sp. M165 TaxID=2593649 RepID=UPI00117F9F8A|nr:FG-GAP-like repeat-containing protein [Aliiglaciecola sp. M165]TRY33420.1 hypothetical protein FM019_05445 [Aliiglaciecola sp. M165]
MPSVYSRFLSFILLSFAALSFSASALDESYQLYEKNGEYYLKTDPTWVPISGSVFIIIPVYEEGDLLKLTNSSGSWQVENITYSQFSTANPSLVAGGSVSYSDLNSDGIMDLTVFLGASGNNEYVYVENDGSGGFAIDIALLSYVESAPQVNTPSLPTVSNTLVGVVGGEFRVSESGAATYAVSLELPSGIAGVTPEVAVSYNSQSGNGHLGIGWNISAASSIDRCRATREQDGYNGTISNDGDDRFCLNGQKLILVSGTYGNAGAEYRTEIDSGIRVKSEGVLGNGPLYFTVEGSDGSTSYFGDSADSRHTHGGNAIRWLMSKVEDNYQLTSNAISYNYVDLSSNPEVSEIVLDTISYSGNTIDFDYSASSSRTDANISNVLGAKAGLSERLESITISNHDDLQVRSYHFGYESDSNTGILRLASITKCGSSASDCYEPTTFEWNNQGQNLYTGSGVGNQIDLGNNQVYSPSPADLNSDGFSDVVFVALGNGNVHSVKVAYNYSENGFADAIRLFSITSSDLNLYPPRFYPVDVDGDGYVELIYYTQENGDYVWKYFDADEQLIIDFDTCFADDFEVDTCAEDDNRIVDMGINLTGTSGTSTKVTFADINSDAYPDMIYVSGRNLYQRTNNKSGGFTSPLSIAVEPFDTSGLGQDEIYEGANLQLISGLTLFDIDSNGTADLLFKIVDTVSEIDCDGQDCNVDRYDNISWGMLVGDELKRLTGSLVPDLTPSTRIFAADINGDGMSDIYEVPADTSTSPTVRFQLSDGSGQYLPVQSIALNVARGEDASSIRFIDLDKDYRPDLIYFDEKHSQNTFLDKYNGRWEVAYQDTDGGFIDGTDVSTLSGVGNMLYEPDQNAVLLADWTGDGDVDLGHLQLVTDGSFVPRLKVYRDVVANNAPNKLRQITNGFGLTTTINYNLMNSESIYKKGTNAHNQLWGRCRFDGTAVGNLRRECSPVFDLISPYYLVSSVTSDAPSHTNANDTLSVEYFYEGMRAQSGGRGMLGFEKLYTHDVDRDITTVTTYRQDFPFIGMPANTVQYLGEISDTPAANKILSRATNVYDVYQLSGGATLYPYLDISTQEEFAVNDAGTTTLLKSVVVTDNDYERIDRANLVVANNTANHANLKQVTVEIRAGLAANTVMNRVTTVNSFSDENVDNWWLNRISATTVTHERIFATDDVDTVTRSSEFTYNANGVLETEVIAPSGNERTKLTTLHCYDTFGNETGTHTYSSHFTNITCATSPDDVDVSGNIYKVYRYQGTSFDASSRYAVSTENAYFYASTIDTFSIFGTPTKTTDINGVVTEHGLDAMGNVTASKSSLGATSSVERQFFGDSDFTPPAISETYYFVEKQETSGKPTVFAYFDKMGRQVASAKQGFDGTYIVQINRYDKYGRTVAASKPHYLGATAYFETSLYDDFNRLQSTSLTLTDGGLQSSSVAYAANGLSVTTTVSSNFNGYSVSQTKSEFFDRVGKLEKITDTAISGETNYRYNATGDLVRTNNVDGTVITNAFDDYGRKTSMNDPDKGNWSYRYNALGKLVWQQDARGSITQFYMDKLGRTLERAVSGNGVNESTNYSYLAYSTAQGQFVNSHLLQSESLPNANHASKQYIYDSVGRPELVRTVIDGVTYTQKTTYDEIGRVFQQFDADESSILGCEVSGGNTTGACWGVRNHYNGYGYLFKQEEAKFSDAPAGNDNKVTYMEIEEMDALGNVTRQRKNVRSNNIGHVTTVKTFDAILGFNTSINATSRNSTAQSVTMTFDGFGNLRNRENATSNFTQEFEYDDAFRLLGASSSTGANGMAVADVTYDDNGNITSKSDVANGVTYQYGQRASGCSITAGPHALTQVGNQTYCYDANGNQTKEYRNGSLHRNINYHHFDKASQITANGEVTSFYYDANRNRYKRVSSESGVTKTTYYLGNLEIIQSSDASPMQFRRYIPGGVQTRYASTSAVQNSFLLKDHLGSVDTILNQNGQITEKVYMDPWGKRTKLGATSTWSASARAIAAPTLTNMSLAIRGFTGHEHVEHADIIHMNGRIYDPSLGRFLQADPFIQAPKNSQSFNRYSYIINNPLSGTDPSGYIFSIFKPFNNFAKQILRSVASVPVLNAVAQAAACYFGQAWGCAAYASATTYATTGNLRTAFKNGAIAFVTAKAFQKIGQHFQSKGIFNGTGNYNLQLERLYSFGGNQLTASQIAQQIAAHAVVGGVAAELSGGKFGHGFVSAGVTKGFGGAYLPGGSDLSGADIAQGTVVSMIIGGTASVITGGKFANGAQTAAAQYLFNQATEAIKSRTVFRALTPEQRKQFDRGLGIYARNRIGSVTPEQHVGMGKKVAHDSPWISASTQLNIVKDGYVTNESGIVLIDLSKVDTEIVTYETIGKVWVDLPLHYKLAYHRSFWAQEVLIKGHIPQEALTLWDGKGGE